MRGFPKYNDITTRKDVENLLLLYPNETKTFLEELILDIYKWETSEAIINPEEGIEDEMHQLTPVQEDNKIIGYRQQTLVEDENSRLYRLGYTLEEATELVNSLN